MNRLFPNLWTALIFGMGWSLTLTLALTLMPDGIPARHCFGGALALSGAAIVLLTARRQKMHWTSVIFANLTLFSFVPMGVDAAASLIGTAAALGWVRSAGRQPGEKSTPVAAEIIATVGAIGLAAVFRPSGALSIGLCIWIFYLLQIIPMALADNTGRTGQEDLLHARFERSRQRVEKILAARL